MCDKQFNSNTDKAVAY
ncbi:hypothetical protein ACIXMS_05115 [Bacteroides fragilis]|uniref:Uncharacterized protein n=1 Tax=Bacteroides fragilis TaxID=817 RepID=A0A642KL11_BACFG|nr:hypothetical protein F3B26_09915 [Bacteroides fragilis]KAA5082820.1 hypothetical protein F2Z40_21250 [Bacteroides fragilis]KAA5084023.1 hypothetical protein F2Z82_20345 [Bacteroides fragilis]KAA5085978.1 hypothetical protein F2Z45_20375 [Bacteroides fragilis]KAA5096538.1 hypothetical protein F2Z46_20185 [Bacteroides fragilis]